MANVKITYVNRTFNRRPLTVFAFTKNKIYSNDHIEDCVAWKVIENIGRESSCEFCFSDEYEVCASWNDWTCKTNSLPIINGRKYVVSKGDTGCVLEYDGYTSNPAVIEVKNEIHVKDGIRIQIYNSNRLILSKESIGFDLKASFKLKPVLYWGIASEIQEGNMLNTAILESDSFYEQNLEGVSSVFIGLYGNDEEGYEFKVECEA